MCNNQYIKKLLKAIVSGRFNWEKYRNTKPYYGVNITTQPLFASNRMVGFTITYQFLEGDKFTELSYDWELDKYCLNGRTIDIKDILSMSDNAIYQLQRRTILSKIYKMR